MSAGAIVAARTLAGQGYAVFPCLPSKRPATPHGFKEAVRDPGAVEELWARHPGVLVGVATGMMSGVSVLDIDKKHNPARAWWGEHRDRLLPARVHRTRSGGLHLVYRHRPGLACTVSKLAHGVDVRADGGYVIWWPAAGLEVLADPGIKAWPDWLAVEMPAPPAPSISRRAIVARSGDLRPTLHRVLGIIRTVLDAREGERNRVLFWAACRVRDMHLGDELDHPAAMQALDALRDAGVEVGLTQREIDRTITSAMRVAA
jgi:Bifunctional DNA primase/polymerase, N-terminal/Primase C terminal 1 (PriCT-1)